MPLLVFDCHRRESNWEGTIEKVDGVTIVKNPISPLYNDDVLIIENELSIGEATGRDEYMFSAVSMIAVDDEDNIYVADSKQKYIRVFDKDGNYLRTIGRSGQGPGEFTDISSLSITPQNELMVNDRYASKFIFFSLMGNYLRTDILEGLQAGLVHRTSKGTFYVITVDFQGRYEDKNLRAATEVNEYTADLTFIRTVVKDKYWSVMSALQPAMLTRFSPVGQIVCGLRENYEIHIFNLDGEMIRKVFKEYEPYELSEKEKDERHLTDAGDLPKYFPPYENISIDDEGRLFVQLYEKPKDANKYYFDVFNAEGMYVAKVALKVIPQCWKRGKLYTIEEDESGYQHIKRYKITWNF